MFFSDKSAVWSIGDLCYMNRYAVEKTLQSHDKTCSDSVMYGNNGTIKLNTSYNIYSIVLTVSMSPDASFIYRDDIAASYAIIIQTNESTHTQDAHRASCDGVLQQRVIQSKELIGNPGFRGFNETIDCRFYLRAFH
jgi:hypothetical protein